MSISTNRKQGQKSFFKYLCDVPSLLLIIAVYLALSNFLIIYFCLCFGIAVNFFWDLLIVYFQLTGSLVRPKVVKSVHFCPSTGKIISREYRDITSTTGLPTGSVYPTRVMLNFHHVILFSIRINDG